jgi:hypothetical protein
MNRVLYFLFLIPVFGQAQDWQNICSPGITYFLNSCNAVLAFRQDSVILKPNSDTLFISYNAFRDTSEMDCIDTTNGAVLGRNVYKSNNGWFYFFNKDSDTIGINTQATLNEVWKYTTLPAGCYLEAKVTAIQQETIFGQTDQVKVITLQAKQNNGQTIPHSFNGVTIELSQHYGLIRMYDVYQTPYDTMVYTLIGKTSDNMGFHGITWQDIYNYDIGDEFHYTLSATTAGEHSIKIVIDKTAYGYDSVVYTFAHCYQGTGSTGYWSGYDTITEKYNFHSLGMNYWAAHLPMEVNHGDYGGNQYHILPYYFSGRGLNGYSWGTVCFYGDSCWNACPTWEYPHGYEEYVVGLGNTSHYYSEMGSNGNMYMHYDLVYYKKGSETWGTPVATDCEELVGIYKKSNHVMAESCIRPNPVSGQATLVTRNIRTYDRTFFVLTDLAGKDIMQVPVKGPSVSLDFSSIPKGLYIYHMIGKDGNLILSGKVVVE